MPETLHRPRDLSASLHRQAPGKTLLTNIGASTPSPRASSRRSSASAFGVARTKREEARQDMFDHIEMFYNPVRKHVRNGMLSLVKFERQQALQAEGV